MRTILRMTNVVVIGIVDLAGELDFISVLKYGARRIAVGCELWFRRGHDNIRRIVRKIQSATAAAAKTGIETLDCRTSHHPWFGFYSLIVRKTFAEASRHVLAQARSGASA